MKSLPWYIVPCLYRRFFLLGCLSLLLVALPAAGEELTGSSQASSATSSPEKYSAEANGAGVIFEEPLLNGTAKEQTSSLPEPADCLEEPSAQKELPRVAIIIDDMGHHKTMGNELLDLEMNLTFSFLPHAPFTREQQQRARKMGRDILLHMPMEPNNPSFDPGPGTLYVTDSPETLTKKVEGNITEVPHAIGVNNHMGSKFTADRRAMHEVMSVLKKNKLFFVDSLTTSSSVGAAEARNMGIRTGQRSVFLDNVQTTEDICRQLKRLVAHAKKYGRAIGIGHPNRATINALESCRELLQKQVRIVGAHELLN